MQGPGGAKLAYPGFQNWRWTLKSAGAVYFKGQRAETKRRRGPPSTMAIFRGIGSPRFVAGRSDMFAACKPLRAAEPDAQPLPVTITEFASRSAP
jgi:hypothetical protein